MNNHNILILHRTTDFILVFRGSDPVLKNAETKAVDLFKRST
jgi:hypothetical protein